MPSDFEDVAMQAQTLLESVREASENTEDYIESNPDPDDNRVILTSNEKKRQDLEEAISLIGRVENDLIEEKQDMRLMGQRDSFEKTVDN